MKWKGRVLATDVVVVLGVAAQDVDRFVAVVAAHHVVNESDAEVERADKFGAGTCELVSAAIFKKRRSLLLIADLSFGPYAALNPTVSFSALEHDA